MRFLRRVLLSLFCLSKISAIHAAPVAGDASRSQQPLGPWSISAGFPNGGSVWGVPAFGLRHEIAEGDFLGVGFQLAANREEKSESIGLMAKWQHLLFTSAGRSFPYAFVQMGLESSKESESAKVKNTLPAAIGFGVEVSLLKEISTSFETGFGGVFYPSSQIKYSTATTQISLHYHFQY